VNPGDLCAELQRSSSSSGCHYSAGMSKVDVGERQESPEPAGQAESGGSPQALASGSSDGCVIVWLLDLRNDDHPWTIAATLKVTFLTPTMALNRSHPPTSANWWLLLHPIFLSRLTHSQLMHFFDASGPLSNTHRSTHHRHRLPWLARRCREGGGG